MVGVCGCAGGGWWGVLRTPWPHGFRPPSGSAHRLREAVRTARRKAFFRLPPLRSCARDVRKAAAGALGSALPGDSDRRQRRRRCLARSCLLPMLNRLSVGSDTMRDLSPPLTPYVDPLPVPRRLRAADHDGRLTVSMRAGTHRFHRDLPESPIWGFDGGLPGPTIEAERGQPVSGEWRN